MSKNGFLIALEGLERPGMVRIGERLSKKLSHNGYDSIFGAEPAVSPFRNYFREMNGVNVSNFVSSTSLCLNLCGQLGYSMPAGLEDRIRRIISNFCRNQEISKIDLQTLLFFERKFHLRTKVKDAMNSGHFVVLKGYELMSFAYGISSGISFEDILSARNEVLGEDYIRPDVTILVSTPPKISADYFEYNGAKVAADESEKLALGYEIAAVRLQGGYNYGFVSRVRGELSEGLIFKEAVRKLSRFIPTLL